MPQTSYEHEIICGTATTKLKILRVNRTKTNPDGEPLYSVTEIVGQHQADLQIGQTDWTGGHGQYQLENPNAYFDGQSVDTTQEGRVMLGPTINEVYQAPTSAKKDESAIASGDYGGPQGATWVGQTFTTTAAYTLGAVKLYAYRIGSPGTITVRIYATAAGVPTGAVLSSGTYDGNSISNVASEWVTIPVASVSLSITTVYAITVSEAASSGSNYFQWNVALASTYAGGTGLSSADSGTSWSAVATRDYAFETWSLAAAALESTPTCFLWASTAGKWLVADSTEIYYYDGGNWVEATTQVSGVTSLEEHDGVVYAAIGANSAYWYSTDGDTWVQTTLTNHHAYHFLSAPNSAGTQNVLWKTETPNQLTSTTDGKVGGVQWSSPAYIGDTSNNITNIFMAGDELMVGRTDNLYYYDNLGGIHALKADLQTGRSTNNFKYVCDYQGATYCSVGTGIAEIVGGHNGTYDIMGPLTNTGNIDKVGICVGLTSDSDYLYVAYLENTVTHIYKGKRISGQWSWTPWVYLGANECRTISVAQHSATDRRLWFGYGTHTGWVQITDNPTTDANARFAPSGFVRMSYLYGTNPYYDKMYQSILTETVSCAASITVTPKYRADAATTMTTLASAIATNGVVRTMAGTAISSKRIQFELDLATNDATITPQVLTFIARGVEKPETYRVHEAVYEAENKDTRRSATVRAALRTARASTTLIKFADLRWKETTAGTAGTDYQYVIMAPGFPKEESISNLKGQPPEIGLRVRWTEVNFT